MSDDVEAAGDVYELMATIALDLGLSVRNQAAYDILRSRGWRHVPDGWTVVPGDVRQWAQYPIEMPLNVNGEGPATIKEAVSIRYEVWDWTYQNHGSFDNLPDAINRAMLSAVEKEK